ncbi:MAG: TraM recognition domain-containing protein [Gammaproteobacteria bacterium]|nr:TraM recognition domain-containing protein [Gammaproteobacteria bacterium]
MVRYAKPLRSTADRTTALAVDSLGGAAETFDRLLSWRVIAAFLLAVLVLAWSVATRPFPAPGDVPLLDLIEFEDPGFYKVIRVWHLVMPSVMAFIGVMIVTSSYRLWFGSRTRGPRLGRGTLPRWPTSPGDDSPSLVVGELHHPTEPREITRPSWLTLPERGLYTGVAIFGAVGTGKTSACMRPFARQLLSWQAADPQKRAAALVLEVKGDFCHDIRADLEDAGRGGDYIELGLGGRWQWNPLASAMDSYSLAYTVATLLNQLFGKGKEPFWQQAYTNLIRWLIELHRALPEQWVTFRDLYHCAINPDRIGQKIEQARTLDGPPPTSWIVASRLDVHRHRGDGLAEHQWHPAGHDGERVRTLYDKDLLDTLTARGIEATIEEDRRPPSEHAQRVAAIERWYQYDWLQLDSKLRTSIVEGVSVFLSMFDLPDVARVFCPAAPRPAAPVPDDLPPPPGAAAPVATGLLKRLPPLHQLIESGKVIALNMPAGANPALARTIGVLLKNAWLQTLLTRPSQIKIHPNRYFRPAVFLCDEYQSFASVGEEDPSGDEKAFALTRQCRVIPIVATQSISSLKSVLPGQDAWRTLLQTLRTKVFLSLSDDSSAELASNMCGKVLRLSPSYSFTESAKPGFSVITARAGGAKGTLGTSKSYREQREPLFHARTFSLLENCQAVVLPYDGTNAQSATRVYLKPHYLPRDRPYWRARETRQI